MFVLCKCLTSLREDMRNALFAPFFTFGNNMLATTLKDRSSLLRVLPSEVHAAGRHVHWPFCYLPFFAFVCSAII